MSSQCNFEISFKVESLLATFSIRTKSTNGYASKQEHSSNVLQLNKLRFKLGTFDPPVYGRKVNFFINFQLPEPTTSPNPNFALIVLEYDIFQDLSAAVQHKVTYTKVLNDDSKVYLEPFYVLYNSSSNSMHQISINIKFRLIQFFDCTSALFFTLEPPSKAPLFWLLNQKDVSNCSFKLKTSDMEIWVNKQILSKECPFFEKMLQKEWSQTSDIGDLLNPIEFSMWSDEVVVLILLHLYTGWLPGTPICEEVLVQLNMKKEQLALEHTILLEVHELAEMLELHILAFFAALEAKLYLTTKVDALLQNITNITIPF